MIDRILVKTLKVLHLNKVVAVKVGKLFLNGSKIDFDKARENISSICAKPNGSCLQKNQLVKEQYDLKIIIPAYNAEKYLQQCIESVLSQKTQFSYCVSIINDGSTDKTDKVLEQLRGFENIVVETHENRGAAASRNCALRELNCKYIMFLDADDVLCPDAVQNLVAHAENSDLDIVEGSYNLIANDQIVKSVHVKPLLCGAPLGVLNGFPWGKVFRSTLFQEVSFPEGFWFEDTVVSLLLYRMTSKAGTIDSIVYGYRVNNQGASATANKNVKCIDSFWVMEQCIDDSNKLNLPDSIEYYKQIVRQMYITQIRTCNMPDEIRESLFVLGSGVVRKRLKQEQYLDNYWLDLLNHAIKSNNYKRFKLICALAEL